MNYSVGELDQRVSLQSSSKTRNASGGAATTWAEYAEVWAKVRPMTGGERERAQRVEATADYLVVIRYNSSVDATHRIIWRGRALNIRFIRTAGPRPQFLEIEAEIGASS